MILAVSGNMTLSLNIFAKIAYRLTKDELLRHHYHIMSVIW